MRILLFTFLLISTSVFSQVSIGVKLPNKNTDLTLGSENKGMVPNRVKLQDVSLAAPLKAESMVPGIVVYNTYVDVSKNLHEGYYFWNSRNSWSRLYVKYTPTREFNFLVFKRTTKTYKINPIEVLFPIDELAYEHKALEDGTLFIDLSLYNTLKYVQLPGTPPTDIGVSNLFCYTTIKDDLGVEVFKGVTGMSPYISELGGDENKVALGFSNFIITVKKGRTYKITHEADASWLDNEFVPLMGTLETGGKKVFSSMKVTFLSNVSS